MISLSIYLLLLGSIEVSSGMVAGWFMIIFIFFYIPIIIKALIPKPYDFISFWFSYGFPELSSIVKYEKYFLYAIRYTHFVYLIVLLFFLDLN